MRDLRQMQRELLAYHIRVQNDALRMQVLRDKARELMESNDAASAEIARLTTEIDSWSWSRDYSLSKTLAIEIENRRLHAQQTAWGCIRRFFRFITFR